MNTGQALLSGHVQVVFIILPSDFLPRLHDQKTPVFLASHLILRRVYHFTFIFILPFDAGCFQNYYDTSKLLAILWQKTGDHIKVIHLTSFFDAHQCPQSIMFFFIESQLKFISDSLLIYS